MPIDAAKAKSWTIRRLSQIHHAFWWTRAKTLGVRAIVLDGRGVLLVRHTYVGGWHFPGGAVDAGESAEAAAARELREEAGIVCTERPALHGFYRNRAYSRRDYVVCYVVRHFTERVRAPDWEIAETGFFPVDALPDGATKGTRARLAELFAGQRIDEDW